MKTLIIVILFPAMVFAQDKMKFHAITSIGVVAGESTAKPTFQFTPGIASKKYFAGIGVGYDAYRFYSYPLFVDGRYHFGNEGSGFVYAQGGYNFSGKNHNYYDDWSKTSDSFQGGLYFDAGLGYRIKIGGSNRILFSAGYSQKNLVNKVGYTFPCFNPPCVEEVYRYHYILGRISTRLSWEIGR
jgi:hypothetical protein